MGESIGIYLSPEILACKSLTRTQKELFALLLRLKELHGDASFSSTYLAGLLGIQARHVNRCLKKLKELKWIEVNLSKAPIPGGGFCYEREIKILNDSRIS